MAEHIEVARAFVTIVPSLEGSQKTITQELTGVTQTAATEAGEKSGKTFGQSLSKGLKTTAAVVGAAMAATTAAAAATGKAFINAANSVSEYGNNIDKNSQKLGISSTAYQEWSFILEHTGASIDGMKTAMLKLTKAAESGDDAFKELGISQEQLASMNQEETFSATVKALQNVQDESKRTVLANRLLGKGATELAPLFNTTAEETEAMRKQVHDLNGVMSDEAIKAAATYQDELQNMNTALTGVKNNMMAQFLPSLSTVMNGLSGIFSGADMDGGLQNVEKGITELADNLASKAPVFLKVGSAIIGALAQAISQNLPALLQAAVPVVGDLVNTIGSIAPTLIKAVFELMNSVLNWLVNGQGLTTLINGITTLVTTLAKALSDNIGSMIPLFVSAIMQIFTALTSPETIVGLINAAIALVQGLINGIISAVPLILEQLPVIIQNICDALITGLPLLLDAGIQLFMSLIDALPTIINALMEALPTVINTIIDTVLKALPLLLQAAVKLFMALIQALPTIISLLVKEIPKIVSTVITTLLSRLPELIKGAVSLFMGIIKAIPQIVVELGRQMPTIIKAIVSGLSAGLKSVTEIGGQLIRGLWSGISNMGKWIGEKIKGFGKGVLDGLKSFFKIKSPSRLFRDEIGKNLALGIGVGFENEFSSISDEMVGQMDGLTGNMSATVTANGTSEAMDGATYNGGNITLNIYGAEGQNVNQLAEIIAVKLQDMTNRRAAVYA